MQRRIKGGAGYSYDPAFPHLAPGTKCEIVYSYREESKWRRINHLCHLVRFEGVTELIPYYDEELERVK